jgi:putative oxidoreductase
VVTSHALTFLLRLLLVCLFFPFSALDKTLNFEGALGQALGLLKNQPVAIVMLMAGLMVEVFGSLGILTGIADRLAALVLAVYCIATAVLFKEFWTLHDFWAKGPSKSRDLWWDFLKNLSLAGGILLITFGNGPVDFKDFLANPLGSTHPYANISQGSPP